MIWIIGGTSEARELAERVKDLDNYIISYATDSGREFVGSSNLVLGRMDYEEMKRFVKVKHISKIVDLSHPYAEIVTENAKRAAIDNNIKYIRYIRDKVAIESKCVYLNNYKECYEFLKGIKGTVFFTTGSKNIDRFEKVRGDNRFIYRILPAVESIVKLKENGVKLKDIVAMLGPFSKCYNEIMFKEYNSDYVVMKDSGEKGGTLEKLKACEGLGIIPIVIGRKNELGYQDLDLIEREIRQLK